MIAPLKGPLYSYWNNCIARNKQIMENSKCFDLIVKSRTLYSTVLCCFGECHETCVTSGLFSNNVILKIDQCALDFHQLSRTTVTLSKCVSDQWLRKAVLIFGDIGSVDDPVRVVKMLGNQAKEIAKGFKVIGSWARDLSGRFHEVQKDTKDEADRIKEKYDNAVRRAQEAKKSKDDDFSRAESLRREAQEYEDKWRTARSVVGWIPLGAVVTGVGCAVATSQRDEASKCEREAAERLRRAEDNLQEAKYLNEKAKVQ